jgi:hypothetical protein
MIEQLLAAEKDLPCLLMKDEWQSLFINYEKPFVERIWIPWNDFRLNLHIIHPCDENESFFHPHPWSSAMKIVEGIYQMKIGYGEGLVEPLTAVTCWLKSGSYYEMTNINSWHSVRPIENPVMSIMLTGKPWDRKMPKSDKVKLSCILDERKNHILSMYKKHYSYLECL